MYFLKVEFQCLLTRLRLFWNLQNQWIRSQCKEFNGLLNYLSKCNPNYADITAPLRDLLKDYVVFIWNACQEQAFR